MEAAPYISKMRIRNERTGQGKSNHGTALHPRLFRKKGHSAKSEKIRKSSTPDSEISAEMTGDSCLARAVVPRTAAAVDHADTELIGQVKAGGRISLWWKDGIGIGIEIGDVRHQRGEPRQGGSRNPYPGLDSIWWLVAFSSFLVSGSHLPAASCWICAVRRDPIPAPTSVPFFFPPLAKFPYNRIQSK